jgi:hypothetical protein
MFQGDVRMSASTNYILIEWIQIGYLYWIH